MPTADHDVAGDLVVTRDVVLPAASLHWRFSRAGGPGGQGVNTTDSRVELSVDLHQAPLREVVRERLLDRLGPRLHDGVLTVVAADDRAQRRNRRAARDRLAALLRDALAPDPPSRRPTAPSRAARRRRLESKRRQGAVKALRRRPTGE
ncbi:alternative ribosome rescue aminoacyl-tRNA hydrolase ArfB [Actinomycetospora lemnae]|uniref:Alternative ribosome rescue aminoacyl-tRNA hydrolase ArfB n=1 Tax=Actinomycetospora lemnae TaxID=3019891 RepID=A0ABT5SUJ8_9PSEU|nr:alternative ribosome rescue aminoacyl-tRNA hydrolase ArfB [Actinomycetospora sp. DW7H6]MDD7966532.1 alternative ribosome rescue aminoacyl-tRNA hydrolase ArfB [Actinomycetospora sp. DW7H6]